MLHIEVTMEWDCKFRRPDGGYNSGDERDIEGGGEASVSIDVAKPTCPGRGGKITILTVA